MTEFSDYTNTFIEILNDNPNPFLVSLFHDSVNNIDYVNLKIETFDNHKNIYDVIEYVQLFANFAYLKEYIEN